LQPQHDGGSLIVNQCIIDPRSGRGQSITRHAGRLYLSP
jgi:hypothetical protein